MGKRGRMVDVRSLFSRAHGASLSSRDAVPDHFAGAVMALEAEPDWVADLLHSQGGQMPEPGQRRRVGM